MPPSARWRDLAPGNQKNGERVAEVGDADAQDHADALRRIPLSPICWRKVLRKSGEMAERVAHTEIKDKSRVFNTARIEALELDNLIEVAQATMIAAHARKKVAVLMRATTFRQRDDVNWLKHSLYFREGNRLDYKPVRLKPLTVESFPLKARVY